MNLFSIWRSSSAEILYSKRIVSILYGLVGLLILVNMGCVYVQFFHAYITLGEFDTTVSGFMIASIFLFLPLWLLGAVILRACLQRLRIAIWIRGAIKMVTYSTKMSPAEAGFLVDFSYSNRELVATLLDLHFRGVIQISIEFNGTVAITKLNANVPHSPYEQALLGKLDELGFSTFQDFNDVRLIKAAQYAHELLIQDLTERKVIQPEYLPNRPIRIIFRIVCVVAGLVSWVLLSALIDTPDTVFSVSYPRYAVDVSQIIVLIAIGVIISLILISSAWPRLSKNYKSTEYATWIDATGLLMYVKAVFKHRFSEQNILSQDKGSLRDYAAYAVAYGVIPNSPSVIAKILEVTKE